MKKTHTDCKIGNGFTSSTSSSILPEKRCEHYLPCGVCKKTGLICPLGGYGNELDISW